MGWWRADEEGGSLHLEETGMIWGDEPADIMSDALKKIFEAFKQDYGRMPSERELKGGLLFSLGGIYEEPLTPDGREKEAEGKLFNGS